MGFDPSKIEPDMWIKDCADHCQYIAVYEDDLLIVSKDSNGLVHILTNEHKFKLKVTTPTSCYLGCDFGRDDDGDLHLSPRKHIEKMIDCHVSMFGSKPKLNHQSV